MIVVFAGLRDKKCFSIFYLSAPANRLGIKMLKHFIPSRIHHIMLQKYGVLSLNGTTNDIKKY
jgi:hypothetical protein